ncbi:MAG: flagellar hook-associated protein FlgL [Deltaproteobacteria bacterium]|nr:flagellar hook-associated protein FlgL [Deltaproteobacteria bacterium]
MRVTENMRFNSMVNNLFSTESQYYEIMEKVASQKNVNRASDDPIAATKIIDIRKSMAEYEQYRKNMQMSDRWISAAESKLSSAFDLLVSAQEIAVGQSTATATAATRLTAAQSVEAIIQEMLNLANAKEGDRYLFAGTRNDTAPFTGTEMSAVIETAGKGEDNVFGGNVTSGGTYTGTGNQTYVLKVTTAGNLSAATCQISTDGGRTWNGVDLAMTGGVISLGDGVELTFDDLGGTEVFGENDVFYVNAMAGGFYKGNNQDLSLTINRGSSVTYNLTGEEVFTSAGSSGADIFKILNDLKTALEDNDAGAVADLIDDLKDAQNQISLNQSLCGTKLNHLEIAENNLSDYDEKLTSLLSETQDADLAELATKLAMKELALQASYSVAAKVGELSLLNFL